MQRFLLSCVFASLVLALLQRTHVAHADDADVCRAVFVKDAFSVTYKRKKKATLHSEVRDVLCDTK